jgi:hypothetical protein
MPIKSKQKIVVGTKPPWDHPRIELFADKQEEIEWTCDTHDFVISIAKDAGAPHSEQQDNAPDNPFSKQFPLKGKKGKKIQSGPPRQDAVGQQYKYTAKAGGEDFDPHIIIRRSSSQ